MTTLGPTPRTWRSDQGVRHALFYEGGGWYTLHCEWVVCIDQHQTAADGTVTCLRCLGVRDAYDRRIP